MKSASNPNMPSLHRRLLLAAVVAVLPLIPASLTSSAFAATTISFANNALVTSSTVTSTSGSADINIGTGTWAVGDVVYFSGTSATTNPFGTSATRYYVVSVSGTTIQVSTTPGGTALNATNTTTATAISQGVDWFTTSNWTGGVVPNSNSTIANFSSNSNASANVPVVVNGAATVYGVTFAGTINGDLVLVSGANGTGLYSLTFATDDSSTPKLTLTGGSNSLIALGTSGSGSMKLAVAGTQGLIINSSAGGAITGSGVSATSTAPGKAIRSANVDWSGLSGGIQIERGIFQIQAATGVLTGQSLTVGNAQTLTNNTLAGLNLQSFGSTVNALNGNSLGRVYGASTLTIGSAGGSGTYAGVVGKDFTGALTATVLTKTGSGTQTFSGVVGGTGSVNVNAGTVVYDGATVSTTGNTNVASGATLTITNAVSTGTGVAAGRIIINSGGTLNGTGTLSLTDTSASLTGVSMAGTFAPGTDGTIGTFTLNSSAASRSGWAFEGTGVLKFDLGAGVTSDKMAIIGKVSTNDVFFNNNTINITDLTAGSLATGDYLLFDGDSNTAYSGLTLGSAYSGASFSGTAITAGLSVGTGLSGYASSQLFLVGTDIYLNVTAAAVPEPSTYAAMAGIAALGFVALRRRRKE